MGGTRVPKKRALSGVKRTGEMKENLATGIGRQKVSGQGRIVGWNRTRFGPRPNGKFAHKSPTVQTRRAKMPQNRERKKFVCLTNHKKGR